MWVITGDKQETAINIAISCKLIRHPDSLLICNADSPESAARRIDELSAQIRKMRGEPERAQVSHVGPPRKRGFFARFAHLNPFEDEEANPKHQQNLHLTIAKVGKSCCAHLQLELCWHSAACCALSKQNHMCAASVVQSSYNHATKLLAKNLLP